MTEAREKQDWELFRDDVLDLARRRDFDDFLRYAASMTDRAWRHVVEEGVFSPEEAEKRLWSFYEEDIKFR